LILLPYFGTGISVVFGWQYFIFESVNGIYNHVVSNVLAPDRHTGKMIGPTQILPYSW